MIVFLRMMDTFPALPNKRSLTVAAVSFRIEQNTLQQNSHRKEQLGHTRSSLIVRGKIRVGLRL